MTTLISQLGLPHWMIVAGAVLVVIGFLSALIASFATAPTRKIMYSLSRIVIEPITEVHARLAREVYRNFGKAAEIVPS